MELASRWTRLGAALLDGLIGAVVYGVTAAEFMPVPVKYLGVVALLGLIGYQIWSTGTRGQTIAKRVLGIRVVVKDTGANGGWMVNVVKRGIVVGLLNFIPGFFLVDSLFIFREDRRTVHDMIAGTVVVVGQPDAAA
jgi:uncharacterized RDD family membrane protein YckC